MKLALVLSAIGLVVCLVNAALPELGWHDRPELKREPACRHTAKARRAPRP